MADSSGLGVGFWSWPGIRGGASSSNLQGMKTMTDEARAQVARGWEQSGLTQADYAAQCGISPRTLRDWLSRYAIQQPPAERVRRLIEDTIDKLLALLAALDDEVACQVAAAEDAASEGAPAMPSGDSLNCQCSAAVGPLPEPATAPRIPGAMPLPPGLAAEQPVRDGKAASRKPDMASGPRRKRSSFYDEIFGDVELVEVEAERDCGEPEHDEQPGEAGGVAALPEPATWPPSVTPAPAGRPTPKPMPRPGTFFFLG